MKRIGAFLAALSAAAMLAVGAGAAAAQESGAHQTKPAWPAPVVVAFADGVILIDGEIVDRDKVEARLAVLAAMDPQPEIHISPARTAKYGDIAFVMAAAQRLGLKRMGVIGGT